MEDYVALARAHAPLLVMLVLVITAAAVVLIGHARLAWAAAVAGAMLAAGIALDLATRELLGGQHTETQEGIGIGPDAVGAFAAALLSVATAIAVVASSALVKNFGRRGASLALAAGLIASAAWIGAVLARDFVGMFIAVQTAWLASIGLVALAAESDRAALNGALRMLMAGGVWAALMLFGLGLLSSSIGGIDLVMLAGDWTGSPTAAAMGMALVLLALASLAGVAPLHAWAPVSFGRGSALAALFVGAVGIVGALMAVARLASFAVASPELGGGMTLGLSVLGGISVLIGSAQAIGASNLRRLAAYAATAQAGCVLLAVGLGSPAGLEAGFLQIFALAASVLALVGGAAAAGGDTLQALDGLGRRAPIASVAITAGALSLMGAPLSIGFLGRWRLIEAALGAGWWWAASAAIMASLAGVFYGGRLIERLYFRRASAALTSSKDPWRYALAPALLSAIAAVALGLQPALLLRAAASASMLVLGRAE